MEKRILILLVIVLFICLIVSTSLWQRSEGRLIEIYTMKSDIKKLIMDNKLIVLQNQEPPIRQNELSVKKIRKK